MTRLPVIAMVVASALLSALLTSLIAITWHQHKNPEHQHQDPSDQDFHTWLHANLDLTAAQAKALQPIEEGFAAEQERLRTEIAKAADDLAHQISHHDQSDPAVAQALERLTRTQAELQKLSLDHFFQMKNELTPEQARKILHWTHDSIVGDHSH